ncbi:MAG TPA: sigma-70 family RNA polymerase sigma factor [Chthonomonadaceae bacterium]|nr:sigma-70 family RNA polymerase sigma factor [Chthonomonadaceae bacterium]
MSPGPAQQAEAAAFFGNALLNPTTCPKDRPAPPEPAAEAARSQASGVHAVSPDVVARPVASVQAEDADRALEFDALVAKYEKKIFNVIYRFLGDYEEATDLTQETFLSAYRHYDRFRGEAKVFTWLYQIARNLCINRIRQRDRQRVLRVESLDQPREPHPDGGGAREIADWSAAPQNVLEGKELRQRILAAIETLPSEYKEVILLREFHDLSYNEIVATTGLTLENVKTRLSRARAMLRRKLEPYYRF